MEKIPKIPESTWDAMKRKSPMGLPDHPTASGWSAKEIKERLYRAWFDEKISFREIIEKLIDDINSLNLPSGSITIPPTEWTDSTPSSAQILLGVNVFTAGCVVLIIPEDDATKAAAEAARMSMVINQTGDFDAPTPDSVMIARAEGGTAPTIPLNFRYVVLKTGTKDKALVAMIGVDTAGKLDEERVKEMIAEALKDFTPPEGGGSIGSVSLVDDGNGNFTIVTTGGTVNLVDDGEGNFTLEVK